MTSTSVIALVGTCDTALVGTRDTALDGIRDTALVGTRDTALVGTRDTALVGTRYAEFAVAARMLASQAHRHGLKAPGFRSPPRVIGVDRSLRRINGGVVVSVMLRGRPFVAVLGDMIEGVVVANRLVAREAEIVRTVLWTSVESLLVSDEAQTRVA